MGEGGSGETGREGVEQVKSKSQMERGCQDENRESERGRERE